MIKQQKKQIAFVWEFLLPATLLCSRYLSPFFKISITLFCCPVFFRDNHNTQFRISWGTSRISTQKKQNFFTLFLWMGFNFLKASEPLRGDSLLFTSKSVGVSGTYLIYFRKMKGQHILWYFYKPSRAFRLSRYFVQFSLKAIDITMVRENFEIYGVYITRKWIICKYVVFIPYVYLASLK